MLVRVEARFHLRLSKKSKVREEVKDLESPKGPATWRPSRVGGAPQYPVKS